MIPADIASRLHVTAADTVLQPVANIQEITDKIAGLAPGQRLMADILALLPNGTYRALINQRDITLALPFAAKAGDSLELEVVSNDGKLTLAVVSRPPGETSQASTESVPTTLSRTGQLIASLFGNASNAKSGPTLTAATLNGNQPIASSPPTTAQDILPQLKQAISQSGLFYESHQAEWINGRWPKADLQQEPQGQLAPRFAPFAPPTPPALPPTTGTAVAQDTPALALPGTPEDAAQALHESPETNPTSPALDAAQRPDDTLPIATTGTDRPVEKANANPNTSPGQAAQLVAAPALPLVQQQLEALATQNFVWQGQAWPGQSMRWEIEEETQHRATEGESDESSSRWQTRLRLTLPSLGEVDAQIRLQGHQLSLVLSAGRDETQGLLRSATEALRSQLDEAGLALASVGIGPTKDNPAENQAHGQAES